jgi:hypothetical protein
MVLVGRPGGRDPFRRPFVDRRIILKWINKWHGGNTN